MRRACVTMLAFCASIVCLAVIAGGLLFARLTTGPIDVGIGDRIASALGDRVGQGYVFSVGKTVVEQSPNGPRLAIQQFAVRDNNGRVVVAAPRAGVSVDIPALLFGQVSPKRLEIEDIALKVVRREDGRLAMTAGTDEADLPLSGPLISRGVHTAAQAAPSDAQAGPGSGTEPAPAAFDGHRMTSDLAATVKSIVGTMFDPASPLRAIDRFGIARGVLVVDDRPRNASVTYRNFTVDFDREDSGGIFVTAGADGPSGHWSMSAHVDRKADGSETVDATADHLSVDEVMLAAGLRRMAVDTDMPLSINANLVVGANGALAKAGGMVSFDSGYFRLDDPDHEPVMVDAVTAPFSIDPATGAVQLGDGQIQAGETTLAFALTATPPAGQGEPWHLAGHSNGVFGAERPGEKPIKLDKVEIAADLDQLHDRVTLSHFGLMGPSIAFGARAIWQGNPDGAGFTVTADLELGRTPASDVLRLWPNWVAAPPRNWLLTNLRSGTLTYGKGHFSLTDNDLRAMRYSHSVPDDHSHIEFGVSNVTLGFMAGVPPLRGLDGTGVVTGSTVNFVASKGEMEVAPGHVLALNDGSFSVPDTDPKPTAAQIDLHVAGAIESVADLLSRDALKAYANLPIDASSVEGDVDGRLSVGLLMGEHVPADSVKVGVSATARNFSVDNLIGKEGLEDATLTIVADKSGLRAKGDGRMFGAATTLDIRKPAGGGASEAVIGITLDDAARAKLGMNLGRALVGPVSAKLTTSLSGAEKAKANLELDLTRAAFDGALPGLKKAAGRPAKATCTIMQANNQIQLDGIVFESGSAAIRGAATLDAKGAFQSAKLSQLRLSPGDDMRVDAEPSGNGMRVVVRGSSIDVRPFLKQIEAGEGGSESGSAPGKDLDLDLHAGLLTGQNNQAVSNAELHVQRVNGQYRKVQMVGRIGRGGASISTSGTAAVPVLVISAKDAGAALSFIDIYKRMDGGRLDASLQVSGTRLEGTATVRDFTVKEDPAIKKLAEEELPNADQKSGARLDSSAVPFTRLEASFVKAGDMISIRNGSASGPQMGATVEGSIDFAHDRVALRGTFVPVYGLNNLFAQIPVFGVLLGGDRKEGLFGVNYRIDGSAAKPMMSFDPLSALAPGIFRKIFGAIDNAAQGTIPHDATDFAPVGSSRDRADGPGHSTSDSE